MSTMIEERQLRYLGHIMRYPDQRWVKYMLTAERPKQKKKGRGKNWKKQMEKLLDKHGLTLKMTKCKKSWRTRLAQIFERGTTSKDKQMQKVNT